ncbi:hypothetical protein PCLA_12r0307 [Pseudomonas citronellolis]|nr:hypothetical protein PCLA_12r0307 [Pseudomonas citronellolis]
MKADGQAHRARCSCWVTGRRGGQRVPPVNGRGRFLSWNLRLFQYK